MKQVNHIIIQRRRRKTNIFQRLLKLLIKSGKRKKSKER